MPQVWWYWRIQAIRMSDPRPLAIDLFCGLGGWTEGFLAEAYRVVGFDNGATAPYANGARYPAQLVLQDVLTIHGSQFRNAAVIVASPPCQNYSYLAMPWSRSKDPNNSKAAKALRRKWETEGPDNRLFDACFRIQREAIQARAEMLGCWVCHDDWFCPRCFIPLIVENVRGAQPWVGRSAWNYGSFHLWGDVPALMPINLKRGKHRMGLGDGEKRNPDGTDHPQGSWFRIADSSQGDRGQKVPAYSDPRRNGGKGVHPTNPHENADGLKIGGDWFSDPNSTCRKHGSRSNARKAASAQIAKIPFELARHIAAVYHPRTLAQGGRLTAAGGNK